MTEPDKDDEHASTMDLCLPKRWQISAHNSGSNIIAAKHNEILSQKKVSITVIRASTLAEHGTVRDKIFGVVRL